MTKAALLKLLLDTVDRVCDDCQDEVDFNASTVFYSAGVSMSGSHGFDRYARDCKAVELRAAIEDIEKNGVTND